MLENAPFNSVGKNNMWVYLASDTVLSHTHNLLTAVVGLGLVICVAQWVEEAWRQKRL